MASATAKSSIAMPPTVSTSQHLSSIFPVFVHGFLSRWGAVFCFVISAPVGFGFGGCVGLGGIGVASRMGRGVGDRVIGRAGTGRVGLALEVGLGAGARGTL